MSLDSSHPLQGGIPVILGMTMLPSLPPLPHFPTTPRHPPAIAATTVISSPSVTGVAKPFRNLMSSSFR